jgi:hypothetical protein
MVDVQEKREALIQMYSDFHKEAYGYRPRFNYSIYTLEQLEKDMARFEEVCKENRVQQDLESQKSIKEFERRLQLIMDAGNCNRKTALKWLVESYDEWDLVYGAEYIIWDLGLGWCKYGDDLQKELQPIVSKKMQKPV